MTRHKNHISSAKDLDRLFERGVSEVSRMPQAPMTDAQVAAAAAASKTGAGIWLLSHAKEILIGAVSFAVGVGGTLLVTHALQDKAPSQLPAEPTVLVTADSLSEEPFTDSTVLYTEESSEQAVVEPGSQTSTASNSSMVSSQKEETVKTTTPKTAATSTTSEPVVIKKTVIQRDTVQINETVVVKDTVYIEN